MADHIRSNLLLIFSVDHPRPCLHPLFGVRRSFSTGTGSRCSMEFAISWKLQSLHDATIFRDRDPHAIVELFFYRDGRLSSLCSIISHLCRNEFVENCFTFILATLLINQLIFIDNFDELFWLKLNQLDYTYIIIFLDHGKKH